MTATALLQLDGLTKAYPSVIANDRISFAVEPGSTHALLGENGAGKSTLVKMIYGVLRPDAGTMRFDGAAYAPSKPSDARARGIGMVFQHFSLFEALSVADNIALGLTAAAARDDLARRIVDVSTSYGLAVDPARLVGTLSVGERQRVEIVRCLLQKPKLLIMDEPTSVLTPREVEVLFRTLRRLAAEGCSILYISHKLEEIRGLCTHATVLRGGRVVANCDPRRESAKGLAEMMLGTTFVTPKRGAARVGPVRFQLSGLSLARTGHFGTDLEAISLDLHGGEILGIAGVAGNGQTELVDALIGEQLAPRAEQIMLDGRPIGRAGPRSRRAAGMCFVPEERLGHATVPAMTLWENTLLTAARAERLVRRGVIDIGAARKFAGRIAQQFDVRTGAADAPAGSLSGGNLQKFVVGREMLAEPGVLIVSQPTWGVDAGAAAAIQSALLAIAQKGAAVVVISQDLDELFQVSTRLAVIAGGRLSAARPVGELTIEAIGRAMGGQSHV